MKVFLSWSGQKSHKVATALRDWLPSVIQSVKPYVSSEDIDKGARWSTDIAKELEDSAFGILCVTKDNLTAPWLTFEAGALSKKLEKSYVSPFLFDIKRAEIDGPILQFQSTLFEKEDVRKLIKTINKACGDEKLTEERLDKTFNVWYPSLEKELKEIKQDDNGAEEDGDNDIGSGLSQQMLEEILELTRINQKILRNPESLLPPDYVRYTLENNKDKEKMRMFEREQEMVTKEFEHILFRVRELTDKYKSSEQAIDEEYESWILRLFDMFQHWEHMNMRMKRRK